MEQTSTLPQKLCSTCTESVLSVIPFITLCKESSRKWNDISDYINDYAVPSNTKTVYFSIDGDEIKALVDTNICTLPKATNLKQALRNFKTRLNRVRAKTKRVQKRIYRQTHEISKLRCPECDTGFDDIRLLNQHIRTRGMRACLYCKQIISMLEMKEHLLTHNLETYSCNICTTTFELERSLKFHIKSNHGKGSCVCPDCKKSFKKETGLAAHIKVHQPRICVGCDKKFSNRTCFKNHICTNPKTYYSRFVCDYCGKEYNLKCVLKAHIELKHLKGKEHQCHVCGKKFNSRAFLLEHDNTHNKVVDRYVCEICDLKYSTRRGYQRHMKKHLDPPGQPTKSKPRKKHGCRLCSRNFKSNKVLLEHLEQKHDISVMQVDITDLSEYFIYK